MTAMTQAGGRIGRTVRWTALVTVGGLAFQVFHLFEHLVQLSYWALHPTAAPYMTPWAMVGVRALNIDGIAMSGMELLHLVGNTIFMAAIVGLGVIIRRRSGRLGAPMVWALAIQGLHLLEHVALTGSLLIGGRAIGISTLFGTLQPGPAGWTYRVWFHFMINLAATIAAGVALQRSRQTGPDDLRVLGGRVGI